MRATPSSQASSGAGSIPLGTGVGFRPELAAGLITNPMTVDFVEVIAERCQATRAARREACALAEAWQVVPHGVGLSLGSAAGIDESHAARLGALARELRAPCITEHVAMTRAGRREIGHLTSVPFSREMASVVARNVTRVRRRLPDVPLLLENIAWTLRWPDDAMPEGDFYEAVAERTGCGLLLDVANLYANARNAGQDALRSLEAFPLGRVQMIHVAGGAPADGMYLDTHAHAVPEAVWALLEAALRRVGPVPVLLERDAAFPPFAETQAELARITRLRQGAPAVGREPPPTTLTREDPVPESLRLRQERVVEALLTGVDASDFARSSFASARRVLERKRAAQALELLPNLARTHADLRALAENTLRDTSPAPSLPQLSDARTIAAQAAAVPSLRRPARLDLHVLEARSRVTRAGACSWRWAPWLSRVHHGGRQAWVWKGLGTRAAVHIHEGPLRERSHVHAPIDEVGTVKESAS